MRDLLILVGVLVLFVLCRFIWARRKKPAETFTVLGSLDPVPTKEAIEKRHQIESIDKLLVRVEKKEVEDEFQHAKSLLDSIQEAGRLRDVGEFTQIFGRDTPSPAPPPTPAAPPSPSSPISRRFHRYPRAGEYVFPMAGIDVIDASAVDTSLVGHSYYGDNRSVLADLFWLLRKGEPPESRFGMSQFVREDGSYFAFLP